MFERRIAYRLTEWPELEPRERTAPLLRAFSRMSVSPVTSRWFMENCGLDAERAALLLQRLTRTGVVRQIDFSPAPAPAPEQPQGISLAGGLSN